MSCRWTATSPDDSDDVGPLFEWHFNGDAELVDGGSFKVSRAPADYVRPMLDSTGSMVIGRHLFDLTSGTAVTCPAMRSSLTCPVGPGPAAGSAGADGVDLDVAGAA